MTQLWPNTKSCTYYTVPPPTGIRLKFKVSDELPQRGGQGLNTPSEGIVIVSHPEPLGSPTRMAGPSLQWPTYPEGFC